MKNLMSDIILMVIVTKKTMHVIRLEPTELCTRKDKNDPIDNPIFR